MAPKPTKMELYPNDTASLPTISAEGSTAYLDIGSRGSNGRIILYDRSGDNSVSLNSDDKKIVIKDRDRHESIIIDAGKGYLLLKDTAGNGGIRLDAKADPKIVSLFLGMDRKSGNMIIRDHNGKDSILVEGQNGNIIFLDIEGRNHMQISGKQNKIVMRAAVDSPDIFSSIFIDGESKNIILGNNKIILDGASGDITLRNSDCAEEFEISDPTQIEPGTVMVIDKNGKLQRSKKEYDSKVAGVISGAGDYKPGIVLGKKGLSQKTEAAVALVGKVFCKVDAQYSQIDIGDMLTTSPTPGHAMKANDPMRAFGAVIGKSLGIVKEGKGLVPILVALQ